MATGRLGAQTLKANNVAQSIYRANTENMTIASVSIVNKRNDDVEVSLAITATENAISSLEYIEHKVILKPKCVLERTGIAVSKGQYITASSDLDRVDVVAWGMCSGDVDADIDQTITVA